jgi:hypothetical protein
MGIQADIGSVSPAVDSSQLVDHGLDWKWTSVAVLLGAPLISAFTYIVAPEIPRPDVAILVGALTFVLTGILLGFKSPGTTILEGLAAGAILTVLTGVVLIVGLDFYIPLRMVIVGVVGGPVLTMGGAWVGEMLEGTLSETSRDPGLAIRWIGVGILLGFMLSNYSVFMTRALFDIGEGWILLCYALSFIVTGAFVGYFSPGATLAEPTIAGAGVVTLEGIFLWTIMDTPFFVSVIVVGIVGAAIMGLIGGMIGELVQGYERRVKP